MTETTIPIMVVEDEPRTRDGLCRDLEATGVFRIVAVTDDADEAVRLANDTQPEVILMDLRLRQGSSLEAISTIRREMPRTRILVVSVAPLAEVAHAVRRGAQGYIDKYATASDLTAAVLAVHDGMVLPEPLPEHLITAIQREDAIRALTPQQLEVLRYVAHGYYNDHIAKQLKIELRTVNRHLENIRTRLGVHRRGDLAAIGREWGLEPPAG